MKWFAAVVVMECRVAKTNPELWDEQVRLIRATNAEAAFAEARRIGKTDEVSYKNADGETVRWKFVGLGALEQLLDRSIRSGSEIFSTLSRNGRPLVLRKNQLTAFWSQRNLHKTADELLSPELKDFAPR